MPARAAADAGSQKTPSSRASERQAIRMSSSETVTTLPFERSIASATPAAWTGSVMRIAEATCLCAVARLDGEKPRLAGSPFREALGVGARVAAAAVGERKHVGRPAELLRDLEGRGFLALETVWVQRVHEHVRALPGELTGRVEGVVEGAPHLEQPRTKRPRLRQFSRCDGPRGLEDDR